MSVVGTATIVHELDWIVGEVLNTLDDTGLAENTLVIFTSDNGGMLNNTGQKAWKAGHRLNGKLLGFKFGAWEGGHRVPLLARWPGKIPPGTESDALISQIDLVPTVASASGAVIPKEAVIDGVDQLQELTGTATSPAREMLVISPNSPLHRRCGRASGSTFLHRMKVVFKERRLVTTCLPALQLNNLRIS